MSDDISQLVVESSTESTGNIKIAFKELSDIKTALDHSAIVAVTDPRGRVIYVNDKFCEVSKYSRAELLEQNRHIIDSGFYSAELTHNFWATITAGNVWRGELCNRAKDNSIYWVDTTIVPYFDEENKPYQYVAILYDITAHKSTEEQLRHQTDILEQTYDSIFRWSLEQGITYWNKNAETLYGYTEAEAVGQISHELLKTEHPAPLNAFLEQLKERGKCEGELRHTTKNGEKIWVESRHLLAHDADGKMVVIETSRDITKRKEYIEHIRQQASLLDKASDAILVCDLNYQITYWNRGAERIYGWKNEEVLGKNIWDLLGGADNAQTKQVQNELRQTNESNFNTRNLTKDKRIIDIESRWTILTGESGISTSYLVINTDITKQKKIEEQFLRAQRMESIGTLAGGIAHDLNNILAPILMVAEILKLQPLDEKTRKWLTVLHENASRGGDLVKQVLTFARGVDGERVAVQLKRIIRDLTDVLRETFPKSITIKTNLEKDLPAVNADPTQLYQVLMNLCVNARDAMPGGGQITIAAEKITLDKSKARFYLDAKPGTYILLTVSDTGTGISKAIKTRIFDPFFTTKEAGKGTGLGLSTTLTIVKSHGGFINLYSEPGRGTQFSVYLPAGDAQEAHSAEETQKHPRGAGETVLLVDDEENIRLVAGSSLEDFGYRVLLAKDGTEALALYVEHKDEIAVVLTDMAMPFMDGAATIRALRRVNPAVKIIAASGLTTPLQEGELQTLGVSDYIPKPYTAEKLLTTINTVLHKK
jgi:PAS domain S-box-containing protein